MLQKITVLVLCGLVGGFPKEAQRTPIVLWHGMGDSCCHPFSLGRVIKSIKAHLPGTHVHSLRIGKNFVEDTLNGFLMHPDEQIEMACELIKSDPLLANGYNGIGFSQGSQFLRGIAQRCPEPRMKNLATFGGQHQGVFGFPGCNVTSNIFCDVIRSIVRPLAYSSFFQENLVQATYWHDSMNEETHSQKSTFIADINNELIINETYIKNLQALDNFVMVAFERDHMVQPIESSWFGYYAPGQAKEIKKVEELRVYDRLGLKKMDEDGKLHFLLNPGGHLGMTDEWMLENVIDKYFN